MNSDPKEKGNSNVGTISQDFEKSSTNNNDETT